MVTYNECIETIKTLVDNSLIYLSFRFFLDPYYGGLLYIWISQIHLLCLVRIKYQCKFFYEDKLYFEGTMSGMIRCIMSFCEKWYE